MAEEKTIGIDEENIEETAEVTAQAAEEAEAEVTAAESADADAPKRPVSSNVKQNGDKDRQHRQRNLYGSRLSNL